MMTEKTTETMTNPQGKNGRNAQSPALLRPATIITGHVNADFDCIAAMVAAKKLYPEAVLIYPGSKERAVNSFFMRRTSSFLRKALYISLARSSRL